MFGLKNWSEVTKGSTRMSRFAQRLALRSLTRTKRQALLLALVFAPLSGCKINLFGAKNSSFVFQDKTMHDTNFQLPASSLQGSGNLSPAEMGLNLIAQCYHYPNGNPVNEKAIRFGTLVRDLRLESPGLAQALLGVVSGLAGSYASSVAGLASIASLNMPQTMNSKMLEGLEDIRQGNQPFDDAIWKPLAAPGDATNPQPQQLFVRRTAGAKKGSIPIELAFKGSLGDVVKMQLDLSQAASLQTLRQALGPPMEQNAQTSQFQDSFIKQVSRVAGDLADPKIMTLGELRRQGLSLNPPGIAGPSEATPVRQILLFGEPYYEVGGFNDSDFWEWKPIQSGLDANDTDALAQKFSQVAQTPQAKVYKYQVGLARTLDNKTPLNYMQAKHLIERIHAFSESTQHACRGLWRIALCGAAALGTTVAGYLVAENVVSPDGKSLPPDIMQGVVRPNPMTAGATPARGQIALGPEPLTLPESSSATMQDVQLKSERDFNIVRDLIERLGKQSDLFSCASAPRSDAGSSAGTEVP